MMKLRVKLYEHYLEWFILFRLVFIRTRCRWVHSRYDDFWIFFPSVHNDPKSFNQPASERMRTADSCASVRSVELENETSASWSGEWFTLKRPIQLTNGTMIMMIAGSIDGMFRNDEDYRQRCSILHPSIHLVWACLFFVLIGSSVWSLCNLAALECSVCETAENHWEGWTQKENMCRFGRTRIELIRIDSWSVPNKLAICWFSVNNSRKIELLNYVSVT